MIKDVLCIVYHVFSFKVAAVRLLGSYQGKNGQIDIVECSWDGTRVYFEEGVRQSQATPNGESVFTYVKLMDELLSRSEQVLVLGCGGGNLATRLSRLGKRLTIVDINPISFMLAQRYFDLPEELPCIVSDFRKFVFDDRAYYDAIAIDVGGPGFRCTEQFDAETCDAIRARLAPGGRIVMNVLVANDIDPTPDRIAARLAGEELRTWIVDEQFIEDRNAVIACIPEKTLGPRAALERAMHHSHERWAIRRGRLRSRDLLCGSR
jgi:SAM-dependent methyltransferase